MSVRLDEHLKKERIRLDSAATTREEVLLELGTLLGGQDVAAREALTDDLAAREVMGSTGVGGGIAFPHARVSFLPGIRLAFVRTRQPVPYDALDGRPVDLFLAVAGPVQGRRDYLVVLGSLSYLFRSELTRDKFRSAATPDEVLALLKELSGTVPSPGA
ncbi:MAG: PTS sugar transporter subunit IIA [bacterium]